MVAETRAQAKDAAELIEVDYEDLPAVADTAGPWRRARPQVHPEAPGQSRLRLALWRRGGRAGGVRQGGEGGQARAGQQPGDLQRDGASRLRRGLGCGRRQLTLQTCTQGAGALRDMLAANLGLQPEQVRVITPDVGGGFGMKAFFYPEYTMAAFAARALGKPVKWTAERGESFLSDTMGRDHVTTAQVAFDADHRILGLRST